MIERQNEIERFEMLLSFLSYVSINPFYLQMLKTVLEEPNISFRGINYPPFIVYKNIQETSVLSECIRFPWNLETTEQRIALEEVEYCFRNNRSYQNRKLAKEDIDTDKINSLLESWRSNQKLRSFLEMVQYQVCSLSMVPLNVMVDVTPQQFEIESFQSHYQIQLNWTDQSIDRDLLDKATQKFFYTHSDYFIKPKSIILNSKSLKTFPNEIFPPIDTDLNPLGSIANHFKHQFSESWKQFQSNEEYRSKYPSTEDVAKFLYDLSRESIQLWNELVKSIQLSNELIFEIGLLIRIVPITLISIFLQLWSNQNHRINNRSDLSFPRELVSAETPLPLELTNDQQTLIGGIIVNWIVEQQIERALNFDNCDKHEEYESELSNIPHTNWIPFEHVPWLLMELEMNITIRNIQVEVARHMAQPKMTQNDSSVRNIVMQMNMGEGKTSVILPMLALSLSSSSSTLVRIIVLKSLFPMNYQSLRNKLGGLLNRRIMPFASRRDMNFNYKQVTLISDRLKQAKNDCDVILISPEDILSFDLLTIDKCRRHEFDTGRLMLSVQRWIKHFVRDILDESDEILHVKYQLIYTVGCQQQVDGGVDRWRTIQAVLNLVKKIAPIIEQHYRNEVSYRQASQKSGFPQFRLSSDRPFPFLCKKIVSGWLQEKQYREVDQNLVSKFILETRESLECLIGRFSDHAIQLFLILRGLLASEVLLVALKKRYRVNFGVNPDSSFGRLMAVPFRAKDVAADRTEFGHIDVAIVLTHLSYYYSGLNDSQMLQCFKRLGEEERDPQSIYHEWISNEDEDQIHESIKQWKNVNLKDYQQRTLYLFPTLRYNMHIINYFLNYFVFPREAKQFPHKLVSSPWDLSATSRSQIITGFSGTSDTQLLLPTHIRQFNLHELRKTDAIVVNNLLRSENECYQCLPKHATTDTILEEIRRHKPNIQVILDVGALFIDRTNREIAVQWLKMSEKAKIDYAVYLESDSIVVCNRQYHHHRFLTSPARERLDRCVVYLDEIHTRGTDFKFPNGFRAAVTLGSSLTKDRLVQACMRMRKLGHGHTLTFWSTDEVHQQILILKNKSWEKNEHDQIKLIDILRWVYENSQETIWHGLHHWATQSLSFQRKIAAFRPIQWNNFQQVFTVTIMQKLAADCLESEIIELKQMYGASKILKTVSDIYRARYNILNITLSREIHRSVLKHLEKYSGPKQRLAQLLDEEQERELEQELEEERQAIRPPTVTPCEPILYEEIKRLSNTHERKMNISEITSVFHPLPYAFNDTTFSRECQPDSWQLNLWISTEFQRVIETRGEWLNPFLRPPRWILVYRGSDIIFLSPFEANWLIGRISADHREQKFDPSSGTTLRLLLPRIKRDQGIFVNTTTLTIPRTISSSNDTAILGECLAALFVFNGTLYFENADEQTAYCHFLGICPKPRTPFEEDAFEKGWIDVDGFVKEMEHRHQLQIDRCRFTSSPLHFVKQLLENRNSAHAPIVSHVGSLMFNAIKLL